MSTVTIKLLTYPILESCEIMLNMLPLSSDQFRLFELGSKVGLNGSLYLENFPCLFDINDQRFYVFLGEAKIDKFTKSTYLNMANLAQKQGAECLIFIQERDHSQKGTQIAY